ncbi:unnamed protein product [Rotaria magnacalcarata]|uniref:F-box domain-containing protein n=1 Tax=Rotaria magnacalcarata TaxID=392030 RepID=A0A815DZY9_9BILA|nr:unnamed protein product [Rotaria magnacalcarata]CAF1300286.1 unnamed protein product [Rotaria magnacalcarata]CAF2130200.1 unnamed protein product [Rotaria magnacalcarata]CAF3923798.1 unnamed protein product [Rotaria magnacalcarata]CAF4025517.1 unnamed protein product [Rotaria magnacalcarata]
MKFRIKLNNQTSSIIFDDNNESLSIHDLKATIQKRFPSLRKLNFHLSLNDKDLLIENQTMSQSGLVNGDTIYILNEIKKNNLSLLSLLSVDHPLTLDEVRDSQTYPISTHLLIDSSQPETDFDYITIVIHALMLESGFQMDTENNYDIRIARKSSTFYVIRYRHKLCDKERITCSLAIMKTDALVTINGIVNSISQACGKLSFNIANYLCTQKEAIGLNAVFPYHHLRDLSRSFKDNLANRLLCKLLEESGQRSSATLIGLPNEIKLRLGKYLPIKSLLALQSTCRDIHNTLNDNIFWHDLCVRDFDKTAIISASSTTENSSNEKNWHKLYQIIYAQKQAILRHQTKFSPMFHTTFVPIAPPPGHPAHRVIFPDPTNAATAGFHPFPSAIYRPIPPGVFRICTANTQQAQTTQHQQAQHHIFCQPLFGLKWVVIFAAATMIPLPPCFHPVWLG